MFTIREVYAVWDDKYKRATIIVKGSGVHTIDTAKELLSVLRTVIDEAEKLEKDFENTDQNKKGA